MKRTLMLLALSMLVIACGDKKNDASAPKDTSVAATKDASGSTTSTTSTSTSTTSEAPAGEGKKIYGVKSGIIEMKNSMMQGKQTIYFDDYGAKQATYSTIEMMGQKNESVQINADGWLTNYDPKTKSGTKMKVPGGPGTPGAPPPTPDMMTDEQKKQYKVEELESRDIAGKSAKGYSMDMSGMKIKAWTWNGIPLYLEMPPMGQEKSMIVEATSVQTDIDIPADKFKVPDDVKVTETAAPGMPAGH